MHSTSVFDFSVYVAEDHPTLNSRKLLCQCCCVELVGMGQQTEQSFDLFEVPLCPLRQINSHLFIKQMILSKEMQMYVCVDPHASVWFVLFYNTFVC